MKYDSLYFISGFTWNWGNYFFTIMSKGNNLIESVTVWTCNKDGEYFGPTSIWLSLFMNI